MLFAWYSGAFVAELAAFAVANATVHPVITVPGYLLGAVANAAAAWWSGLRDRAGVQTTMIPAIWILMRFIAWTTLCFLDLPHGLLPLGSLGRPMGLPANVALNHLMLESRNHAHPDRGDLGGKPDLEEGKLQIRAMVTMVAGFRRFADLLLVDADICNSTLTSLHDLPAQTAVALAALVLGSDVADLDLLARGRPFHASAKVLSSPRGWAATCPTFGFAEESSLEEAMDMP
ncbi:hypothetical protein AK812_SmicGene22555 [Symbiodinium microadriaticum]|uniref:Uncharacterized protein n=1 Tax=Symbiodinium microadriaticum TaxID=2951 RepID=A0A1Q9DJH8_SYMMI|nr:hypothetical protein AK812_SmicGene22555 [Symbiodinium microadriaticum]CAE7668728.1 unnamed protein product [Symbiodinium microadriaticum]CAE7795722.1 unnamed protein product [Symbiodinium sp. KB8]